MESLRSKEERKRKEGIAHSGSLVNASIPIRFTETQPFIFFSVIGTKLF